MSNSDEKKPTPLIDGLMERRTVTISGKINNDIINDVGSRMLALQMRSPAPINIVFDSGGGSVYAALRLCDLIHSLITAPVHGIAMGICGSAATFIMLHCQKRISTPHSRFLIHSGTRSEITIPVNQSTSEHLEQLLKDTRATEEIVTRLYMTRLTPKAWANGNTSEEEKRVFVQKLISRGDQPFDQWFSAEHALEIGLIEEITTTKLGIFPPAPEAGI